MKPLPSHSPGAIKAADDEPPSPVLAATPYSASNRRSTTASVNRVYPWLLLTSTAVAAAFCFLYISKPVNLSVQAAPISVPTPAAIQTPAVAIPAPPVIPKAAAPAAQASLMPDLAHLPGEKNAPKVPPSAGMTGSPATSPTPGFEQTNLRIQHILTAETPDGHLAKIDLDVPVLYRSRNLRWTASEVAEARQLLARFTDYQEKSRMLRAEGTELLDSWNQLIERSIPARDLRADSPTLPTNQKDAADVPRPAGLNTTELIQIQPAGK